MAYRWNFQSLKDVIACVEQINAKPRFTATCSQRAVQSVLSVGLHGEPVGLPNNLATQRLTAQTSCAAATSIGDHQSSGATMPAVGPSFAWLRPSCGYTNRD